MEINNIDDFSFSSNYLLDSIDDQLILTDMMENDPWIGNGICDSLSANFLNESDHRSTLFHEDEMG